MPVLSTDPSAPATDGELLDEEMLAERRRMLLANGRDGWELACTHTFPLDGGQRGGQGQGLRRRLRVQAAPALTRSIADGLA